MQIHEDLEAERSDGADPKKIKKLEDLQAEKHSEWRYAMIMYATADGALQATDQFIAKCDLMDIPPEIMVRIKQYAAKEYRLANTQLKATNPVEVQ